MLASLPRLPPNAAVVRLSVAVSGAVLVDFNALGICNCRLLLSLTHHSHFFVCVPDRQSVGSPSVTTVTTLSRLGALVASDSVGGSLRVLNLTVAGLPFVRTAGVMGTGSTVGAPAQLSSALWMTPAPWSNTTILVPDPVQGRVIEVDVASGLLVKVWLTGLPAVSGVAATLSRMAVCYGKGTSTTKLEMYDLNGALLWSVGGVALAPGMSSGVGALLGGPSGLEFGQDGSYLLLSEAYSGRVTKWNAATGAYMASIGSGFGTPSDVVECWSSGVGTVVADSGLHNLVANADIVTSTASSLPNDVKIPTGVVLVPGLGAVVALQGSTPALANGGIVVLSSVAIETQPVNVTVVPPNFVNFFITLTGISASSGVSYRWTKGGVVVGNSPQFTYGATNGDADAGPNYAIVCTVTHALGRAISDAAILTVVRPITVSPARVTVVVGSPSVTFTASLGPGSTTVEYTWYLGGVIQAVGSAPTFVFTPSDAQGGLQLPVVCAMRTDLGSISSNTAIVTVQVQAIAY